VHSLSHLVEMLRSYNRHWPAPQITLTLVHL